MQTFWADISENIIGYRADDRNYVRVENDGEAIGTCRIEKIGNKTFGYFEVKELPDMNKSLQCLFSKWEHDNFLFLEGFNFLKGTRLTGKT